VSARRWRALLGRAQRWARARVGLAMDGDSTSKLPRPAWPAVGWGSPERAALARNHFIFLETCVRSIRRGGAPDTVSRRNSLNHIGTGHLVWFSRDKKPLTSLQE